MKVRMLTGMVGIGPAGEQLVRDPGDVVDVPDEVGRAWCTGPDPTAEPVGETRAVRREKATRGAREVRTVS